MSPNGKGKCEVCSASVHSHQSFCSDTCRSSLVGKTCRRCSSIFYVEAVKSYRRKICSIRCPGPQEQKKDGMTEAAWARVANAAVLKDWSRQVMAKDRYQCQHCSATHMLHAHHILPFSSHPLSRYDVSNGLTLCVKCHWAVHGRVFSVSKDKQYEKRRRAKEKKTAAQAAEWKRQKEQAHRQEQRDLERKMHRDALEAAMYRDRTSARQRAVLRIALLKMKHLENEELEISERLMQSQRKAQARERLLKAVHLRRLKVKELMETQGNPGRVTLPCETCGKSYTRKRSKAYESRTCSNKCLHEGLARMKVGRWAMTAPKPLQKKCPRCNESFTIAVGDPYKARKYCSKSCQLPSKKCLHCKASFRFRPCESPVYCSISCRSAAAERRVEVFCSVCRKRFFRKRHCETKTCSQECLTVSRRIEGAANAPQRKIVVISKDSLSPG